MPNAIVRANARTTPKRAPAYHDAQVEAAVDEVRRLVHEYVERGNEAFKLLYALAGRLRNEGSTPLKDAELDPQAQECKDAFDRFLATGEAQKAALVNLAAMPSENIDGVFRKRWIAGMFKTHSVWPELAAEVDKSADRDFQALPDRYDQLRKEIATLGFRKRDRDRYQRRVAEMEAGR